MSCEEDEAIIAEYTGVRGDDWWQSWDAETGDLADWNESTLLVQMRAGSDETATLLASSDPADDVVVIDTSATDFSADHFEWEIDDGDTTGAEFVAGMECWVEAQCEIDGRVTTFMRHQWFIGAQVAVPAGGS